MSDFRIQVIGIEKIQAALTKFPRKISSYLGQAGLESAKHVIFPLEGIKKYPPAGPWNVGPPYPYYIRGRGTQTSRTHNVGNSRRFGTQWYAKNEGTGTEIGNSAPYAIYLAGEEGERVYWATSHGWKPLFTTVKRYMRDVTAVYQKWVDKLIKDLGL